MPLTMSSASNASSINLDVLASEQILLNRLAQLEGRLLAISERVVVQGGAAADDPALPASLLIDAESQVELAQGFYLREWDGEGRSFRWAGRGEYFEFRFFVRRRVTLPFVMKGILAEGIAGNAVHAFVDYRPIPLGVVHDGTMIAFDGRIPADPLASGATLTFLCPSVPAPSEIDTRRLSFAFSSLQIGLAEPVPSRASAKPCPPVRAERRRRA